MARHRIGRITKHRASRLTGIINCIDGQDHVEFSYTIDHGKRQATKVQQLNVIRDVIRCHKLVIDGRPDAIVEHQSIANAKDRHTLRAQFLGNSHIAGDVLAQTPAILFTSHALTFHTRTNHQVIPRSEAEHRKPDHNAYHSPDTFTTHVRFLGNASSYRTMRCKGLAQPREQERDRNQHNADNHGKRNRKRRAFRIRSIEQIVCNQPQRIEQDGSPKTMSRTPNGGGQEQRSDVPTGNTFKELLFAGDLLFG